MGSRIVRAVVPPPAASYPPELRALGGGAKGRLVRLEPLSPAHVDALVAAAEGDAELFRWFPDDFAVPEIHRRMIDAALAASAQGREVPFVIVARESGEVVGSTRFLELRLEHRRAEIGFTWVRRSVWGTGINVECKMILLGRAFAAGLRRVEFKTDARNERSRGALLALGATFEGILRKHMVVRDEGARDSAYYSVIDDEWAGVRAGLERRLAAHTAG